MKFIQETDLESLKIQHILGQFTGDSLRIVEEVELFAIGVVKAYVGAVYDIDSMLNQTNRDYMLVRCVLDIMIYDLATRVSSTATSTLIQDRYDKTIAFLMNAGSGKLQLNWTKFDSTLVPTSSMKMGSVESYI